MSTGAGRRHSDFENPAEYKFREYLNFNSPSEQAIDLYAPANPIGRPRKATLPSLVDTTLPYNSGRQEVHASDVTCDHIDVKVAVSTNI